MMMKSYDQSAEVNHNPNCPYIHNHRYGILIIHGSGSGKNNALINLIKHQRPDIGKIYLYIKASFQSKYQLFLNGREKIRIKKLKHSETFIDYSEKIDDIYENPEDYKKRLGPIVTELFLNGRKQNITLVAISQSYFRVSKTMRLNVTHCLIIEISNKRELQQIAWNHSSDTEFKDFMKLYKHCTKEPFSFLVNDFIIQ